MPATVAALQVKDYVKYLGMLLGNVSCETTYAPVIGKMMARAWSVAALPLGMEKKGIPLCAMDCLGVLLDGTSMLPNRAYLYPAGFSPSHCAGVKHVASDKAYFAVATGRRGAGIVPCISICTMGA